MNQISKDMKYCINFTSTVPANSPFVFFLPSQPPAVTPICASSHGYMTSGGTRGQTAIVFGSSSFTQSGQSGNTKGACLDNLSSPRDAMRVLANALGLRNEFMRADRDNYMTLATNPNTLVATNLQSLDIFGDSKKYMATNAANQGPFDAQSITMVSGEQFAQDSSKPVFTLKAAPFGGGAFKPIGNLARLSLDDCSALNNLYGCAITCDDRKLLEFYTTFGLAVSRSVQCPAQFSSLKFRHNSTSVGPQAVGWSLWFYRILSP